MPNHVSNELIFRGLDRAQQNAIVANARNAEGRIDFEILLPSPLNIWPGSVGTKHEKTFPNTHLDWARENWGTKWNAYGKHEILHEGDTLTLRFDTAWTPPWGWIVALFNRFKFSFDHNWLDEGAQRGVCGKFNYAALDDRGPGEAWSETPADDEMQKHLHKLRWGVEKFDDEDAA